MNLITDSQYFPSVILFKNLYQSSNIIFEQYEYYLKMSFRNRLLMASANGPLLLSVPLEQGRNQKTLMKEVRISNRQAWQSLHWKSLESAYNRSPWFEFYRDELAQLYLKPYRFLMDWNEVCFEWAIAKLHKKPSISRSESYQKEYDPVAFSDLRNTVMPKNYLQFEAIKYRQVFEDRIGFLPNLSILDLLFCEGKMAAGRLEE